MISVVFIGLSLAMDAFAISLANGMSSAGARFRQILLMSGYFGFFQFFMPLAGSFLTGMISGYVESYGPYISFLLLGFIGLRMIMESRRKPAGGESGGAVRLSHRRLLAMALATSIDALAVGVSFAFMDVPIVVACVIIGAITFVLCVAGGVLGGKIPGMSGAKAETIAGIVLIGIGIKLLVEGLV